MRGLPICSARARRWPCSRAPKRDGVARRHRRGRLDAGSADRRGAGRCRPATRCRQRRLCIFRVGNARAPRSPARCSRGLIFCCSTNRPTISTGRAVKRWRAILRDWQGGAIVVSHDRELLEEMDAIVELTATWAPPAMAAAGAPIARARWSNRRPSTTLCHRREARRSGPAPSAGRRRAAGSPRSAGRKVAARGDMPRIVMAMQRRAEESRVAAGRLAERQQDRPSRRCCARSLIEIVDPLAIALPSTGTRLRGRS